MDTELRKEMDEIFDLNRFIGSAEYQQRILFKILQCEQALSDEDVEGRVWWNKFRTLVKEIKP